MKTFCFYGFDGTERARKHDSFHLCIDVNLDTASKLDRAIHDGKSIFLDDKSSKSNHLTANNSIYKSSRSKVTKYRDLRGKIEFCFRALALNYAIQFSSVTS